MLAKARSRSSSETPLIWSKRARAFLTWEASVSGSLRCLGNAYALSGSSRRSLVASSPCSVCGFHVVLVAIKPVPPVRHLTRSALLPLRLGRLGHPFQHRATDLVSTRLDGQVAERDHAGQPHV